MGEVDRCKDCIYFEDWKIDGAGWCDSYECVTWCGEPMCEKYLPWEE